MHDPEAELALALAQAEEFKRQRDEYKAAFEAADLALSTIKAGKNIEEPVAEPVAE